MPNTRPFLLLSLLILLLLPGCSAQIGPNVDLAKACQAHDADLAAKAIEAGASTSARDSNGALLFGQAVQDADIDLVAVFLTAGVEKQYVDGAISIAALGPDAAILDMLVEAGGDAKYSFPNGATALHSASTNPLPMAAMRLLELGASVDARTKDGETPLFVACQYNRKPVAVALLSAGADPNATNQKGEGPLDWALRHGNQELATALRNKGATAHLSESDIAKLRIPGEAASGLVARATGVMTDGRFAFIRGWVTNTYDQPVEGMYVILRIVPVDSERELERIKKEMTVTLQPGARTILRLDVASMYFGGQTRFIIEANPAKLGGKEVPPPEDW